MRRITDINFVQQTVATPMIKRRHGFSLLELIVVISITSLLAGLLMPALSSVRENARRVMCGSNQRQLGQAITMYSADRRNRLPVASVLDNPIPDPTKLGLVRNAMVNSDVIFLMDEKNRSIPKPLQDSTWDGLGRLFQWHYCDAPECFHCPSHGGEHLHEECSSSWEAKNIEEPLFSNFHYVGHKDWRTGRRRSLLQGKDLVLTTDGLKTRHDYNHGVGYNELRGDGSVAWVDDVKIRAQLNEVEIGSMGLQFHDDLIYTVFSRK